MRIPNAFVTQWTGSKIASAADKVTTRARKLPVYSHAVVTDLHFSFSFRSVARIFAAGEHP